MDTGASWLVVLGYSSNGRQRLQILNVLLQGQGKRILEFSQAAFMFSKELNLLKKSKFMETKRLTPVEG